MRAEEIRTAKDLIATAARIFDAPVAPSRREMAMTIGALGQSSGGSSRVKISLVESVVGKSFWTRSLQFWRPRSASMLPICAAH
jgi:hypothetical protein